MAAETRTGPLTGIKVVDWTQYGAGPFGASLLGALGADVIHIEVPPHGDPQSSIAPTIDGIAAMYVNYNLGKRSAMLDLRADDDRERMWELVRRADVLVTNFKPDSLKRLGFGADEVLAQNPDIVYCISNGWGDRGPRAGHSGGDHAVQAFCGWCSVTGAEGAAGEFLRYLGHIDLNTSLYIAAAALTGLAARDRIGGQAIDISMLEAALAMQSTRLSEYLRGGVAPGPLGSSASVVAPSQAFRCQDAEYIAVSAETDGQWRRLCDAIERPELADRPEYATNADRVVNRRRLAVELGAVFETMPRPWWLQQLAARLVPSAAFWDFEMLSMHPQVLANEHVVEVDTGRCGVVTAGGPPWKFERSAATVTRNPYPGEHTAEVIAELQAPRVHVAGRGSDSPLAAGLPFAGLVVVELSTGISGPYCGALLADQGAEVVKVEPPSGDRTRAWGPPFVDGVGTAFAELNRNKRLVTLDCEHDPCALERLRALVDRADVVIADAVDADGRPPTLDLRELRRLRPELVACSISAYGERGPLAGLPGSELTVQAMSNTWAGLGSIGAAPRRLGADQASMNAGLTAYQGIVAALIVRRRTGEGDRIETSALGAHLCVRGQHLTCRSNPDGWPGLHLGVWTDPPNHGIATGDRPVLLTLNPRFTRPNDPARVQAMVEHFGGRLPEGLDLHAAWGEPGHPMHPRWHAFWGELFAGHAWEEVERVVAKHGGEVTPFMDYTALDADPQIAALEPFVPLDGWEEGERVPLPGAAGGRVVRVPWTFRSRGLTFTYRPAYARASLAAAETAW
jgi:CoA:oxalate CoA-transferase